MGWGQQEIRAFRELVEAGCSDEQIADEMNLSLRSIAKLRRQVFPPAPGSETSLPPLPISDRGGATSDWTAERTQRLSDLYLKGWTASAIASHLGGISRNAVIGKVHRLGLARGERPSVKVASIPKPRQAKPPAPPKIKVVNDRPKRISDDEVAAFRSLSEQARKREAFADLAPDGSRGVSVLKVRDGQCRWPLGDMMAVTTRFCGLDHARPGEVFCSHHRAMAYLPAPIPAPRRAARQEGARA